MSRSFRRWPRIKSLSVIALAALVVYLSVTSGRNPRMPRFGSFATTNVVPRAGPCEVLDVLDSATLFIRQPANDLQPEFSGSVRLLGIAPPEGEFATEAVKVLKAQKVVQHVRLELDKRRIDAEGVFVAYVYVGDLHLSESLVEKGLARVRSYPGDSMSIERQLLRAQDQARIKQLGIWSPGK